ncbi:MAG: putative integrase [Hyphomicrobiales bacterium]|nr:putative integrase [Hyphomicrobiales bacterium]
MAAGTYLTKRKRSQHWQLELRFPTGFEFDMLTYGMFEGKRHFIKSMKTPDRAEAEFRAAEHIHHFRLAVYRWRQLTRPTDPARPQPLSFSKGRKHPDGLQQIDGMQAVVVGPVITFYGPTGQPMKIEENPLAWRTSAPMVEDAETAASVLYLDREADLPTKFKPKRRNGDDAIIEAYIKDKALQPRIADDARSAWAIYKEKVGTPLSRATRKDGKELARMLAETGAARATVQKKVGWLSAAITHAIAEDQFAGVNPFSKVVTKVSGRAEEKRPPLSEAHMAQCWANLHRLSSSDQVLWKFLAKTGARLGEAISITREFEERGTGIRFVTVGTKTDASHRNIPIPDGLGLPAKITGVLFPGGASAASKRLNRFIKASIPDWCPGLVVHSLRHRAIDVFRLVGKGDPYFRRRLVGHAAQDVHDAYGASGPPMYLLLPMIDANPIDGSLVWSPDM